MSKILIIGGGVSGLSAGIYAQLNGHQAVICERHNTIGGNLTGWQRGDYHIDNCIHWLTGTNPCTNAYKIWQELGVLGDVEIMQGETLYTCEYNGQRLSLHKDLDKIQSEMLRASPNDRAEILNFIKAIKILQYICDIGGKNHDKGCGIAFYLKHMPTLIKYHRMSTGDLAKRFKSPLIRQFITCFMTDYFASLALLFVFAHFTAGNGGIPRGSSYAMAQRMANKFTYLGGELITGKEVAKVNLQNGSAHSVTLSDGTTINCDYVIATTDPKVTFDKIFDFKMPKQLLRAYNDKRLIRFSSYQCAFSYDEGALDFTGDLIFEIPPEYQKKLHTKHLILREFSHEKDFAPKGKGIIQSLTFCSNDDCLNFIKLRNNKLAYNSLKEEISNIISKLIIEKFPQLKGNLECLDVWTPATYQRYVNSEIGSFMSFAIPPKYVPSRISNKIKGLDNVFLATQWLQSPGGLPIAALGGKLAIKSILKREKQLAKRHIKKPIPVEITN